MEPCDKVPSLIIIEDKYNKEGGYREVLVQIGGGYGDRVKTTIRRRKDGQGIPGVFFPLGYEYG